jgi:threonine/homoserine/homoserine lactone efflux protein
MHFLLTTIISHNYQDVLQNIGIFEMIVKGIIIGVVASAPMGPVGILCVQRTLNKGHWAGFFTGAGAALSDLIYALATGLGMSFIVNFITEDTIAYWLKLIGCILLFFFGWYTFRTTPKYDKAKVMVRKRGTMLGQFISGFFVTFSNPLIIFLFISLFSQFTFVLPSNPVPQIVGYISIVIGALGWWFLLTWLIDKVRNRFEEKGIIIINRTIGLVVMTVSAIMAFYTLGLLSFADNWFA